MAMACQNVTEMNPGPRDGTSMNLTCYEHIQWARNTGIYTEPEWYKNVTKDSPDSVLQHWIHANQVPKPGEAWHCPEVCAPHKDNKPNDSDMIPSWAMWMIGLTVFALLGLAVAYLLDCFKKAAPKKKLRAVAAPAREPEAQPFVTYAMPSQVYQVYRLPPTTVVAPPMMAPSGKSFVMAPQMSYAAPISTTAKARPVITYAASAEPVRYVTQRELAATMA